MLEICGVYFCCKEWYDECSNYIYYSLYLEYLGLINVIFDDFCQFVIQVIGLSRYYEMVGKKKQSFFVLFILLDLK